MENPFFYSAILKYAWDGFDHEIVADGLNESEAKAMEKALIASYKANDRGFGYNLTSGGDGTPGHFPSEETRRKLSSARRKENLSEETLRRRSEGLRGRKFSNEHKRKIGEANSKPVEMLGMDGVSIRRFKSAYEAEQTMGIGHSHISQCCTNKRRSTGGYRWKFAQ